MSKCPYCKADLSIEDFFDVSGRVSKKGNLKISSSRFKGDELSIGMTSFKMWACLECDTILGFSEHRS